MRHQVIALLLLCCLVACSTEDHVDARTGDDSSTHPSRAVALERAAQNRVADPMTRHIKAQLLDLCRQAPATKTFEVKTVDGVREFIIYSPVHDCTRAIPAVLVFHAGFGTASGAEDVSPFQAEANKAGSWIVYPNGIDRKWNDGRVGDDGKSASNVDDVGFVNRILDLLSASERVDMKRIYSTGHSNGGTLSLLLICKLSHRLAAVATNGAALPEGTSNTCKPSRPVPLLMANGTDDNFMLYGGGEGKFLEGQRLSVDATANIFARVNSCGGVRNVDMPNIDKRDEATSTRHVRSGCMAGAEVQNIEIIGGGHTWPGSKGSRFRILGTGNLTMDFSMSAEAMKFFKRFSMP